MGKVRWSKEAQLSAGEGAKAERYIFIYDTFMLLASIAWGSQKPTCSAAVTITYQ